MVICCWWVGERAALLSFTAASFSFSAERSKKVVTSEHKASALLPRSGGADARDGPSPGKEVGGGGGGGGTLRGEEGRRRSRRALAVCGYPDDEWLDMSIIRKQDK